MAVGTAAGMAFRSMPLVKLLFHVAHVRAAGTELAEAVAGEIVERVLAEFIMPVELGDQLLAVRLAAGIT